MVCEPCRKVLSQEADLRWFSQDRKLDAYVIHHKDAQSFKTSLEVDKCFLCHRLWEETPLDLRDRLLAVQEPEEGCFTSGRINDKEEVLSLVLSYEGELDGREPSVFHSLYRTDDPTIHYQHLDFAATDIKVTKPIASDWLQTCVATHKTCNDDRNRGNWNPTRLLDIGTPSSSNVFLVESGSLPMPLHYTTLSHRWGPTPFMRLTSSTEASLKDGVPLSELAKTFRDAIEVTRAFGLRFIWIDSFCIRQDQDDESDWLHEVSSMHKVYQHGYFNISATGSVDPSEGLFFDRDPLKYGFTDIDLVKDASVAHIDPYVAVHSSLWRIDVEQAHLNTRGWVLQERVLSKRVFHFGKGQLYWECRELRASESLPKGLPETCHDRQPSIKSLDPAFMDDFGEGRLVHWAYDMWYQIMRTYSRCSLTVSDDKLPAIMGVAKRVNEWLDDTYVAGTWKRFLASGLAWNVQAECVVRSRPAVYRAPTWSWASLDGEITGGTPSDKGLRLRVEDVELDYATADKYGQLEGGRVYVQGILRQITLHRNKSIAATDSAGWSIRFPRSWHVEASASSGLLYVDLPPQSFDDENQKDLLFAMEIIDRESFIDMLLLRLEDRSGGVFSRVGLFLAFDNREALRADSTREKDLPCKSWDAGSGLYTICII